MSDTPQSFDLAIIGAGPGGYVAAIKASQLGLKTALIEKGKRLGGTCLNIGCIPSKALLHSSQKFAFVKHDAARHGIKLTGPVEVDLPTMLARKDKVVAGLTAGIDFLVKKNGITRFLGAGHIPAPGQVTVTDETGATQTITAKNIIIATGSVPVELRHIPFDGATVVSSTEALSFPEIPGKLLVIGGGAIGLELGSVWARLGSEVTVVEFLPQIAAGSDADVAKELQRALAKEGITFHLETQVTAVEVRDGKALVTAKKGETTLTFDGVDKVLVSVGRKPYLEGVIAPSLGLELTQRGQIKTDSHFQTNIPGVYAIGDAITGPMLAHKAEEEGVACVERLAGHAGHVNYDVIPGIIYTHPEAASVGLTEAQAREKGITVKVGKFPFKANGRALANDEADGFAKIITDAKTDRIIGCHIISPTAGDLISEVVTAMEFHASAEDVARIVHAHPTTSEAIKEAAMAASFGKAIHG